MAHGDRLSVYRHTHRKPRRAPRGSGLIASGEQAFVERRASTVILACRSSVRTHGTWGVRSGCSFVFAPRRRGDGTISSVAVTYRGVSQFPLIGTGASHAGAMTSTGKFITPHNSFLLFAVASGVIPLVLFCTYCFRSGTAALRALLSRHTGCTHFICHWSPIPFSSPVQEI